MARRVKGLGGKRRSVDSMAKVKRLLEASETSVTKPQGGKTGITKRETISRYWATTTETLCGELVAIR